MSDGVVQAIIFGGFVLLLLAIFTGLVHLAWLVITAWLVIGSFDGIWSDVPVVGAFLVIVWLCLTGTVVAVGNPLKWEDVSSR